MRPLWATSFLAFAHLTLGSPSLARRGMPEEDFSEVAMYGQYAGAAYCNGNIYDKKQKRISCAEGALRPANNCPSIEKSENVTIVYRFADIGSTGTSGFLAVDDDRKLIVLSFRGTQSWDNFESLFDLRLEQVPEICEGCKVHRGFLRAWMAIREPIAKAIGQLHANKKAAQQEKYHVVATGHSLGGALATIAAVDLRQYYPVTLAAFGSPRVGNEEFARNARAWRYTEKTYRVSQKTDIINDSPMRKIDFDDTGEYAHIIPYYQIDSDRPTLEAPTNWTHVQIVTHDDIDHADLSDNIMNSHNWYINNIACCGATNILAVAKANEHLLHVIIFNSVKNFGNEIMGDPLFAMMKKLSEAGETPPPVDIPVERNETQP